MKRGLLCRRGHDAWLKIEVGDRPAHWRCLVCLHAANASAQRAYAARGGDEFLRRERRRKKIKRGALAPEEGSWASSTG